MSYQSQQNLAKAHTKLRREGQTPRQRQASLRNLRKAHVTRMSMIRSRKDKKVSLMKVKTPVYAVQDKKTGAFRGSVPNRD
jgi:hypothetical protein